MRILTRLASLAALSALAPIAQAQQGNALRIGMADDPDILDPTFSRTDVGTVVNGLPAECWNGRSSDNRSD